MHSRGVLLLMCLTAVFFAAVMYLHSPVISQVECRGFVKGWGDPAALLPEVSTAIELALIAGTMLLMVHINKAYNLLRRMTRLHLSLFAVMLASTPSLLLRMSPGTILAFVTMMCVSILYNMHTFATTDTRRGFLVFAILSGCTSFDVAFVVYIPVFMVACIQLRLFSLRMFSASILGILTPWVIMLGLGIVPITSLQVPQIELQWPILFDHSRLTWLIAVVGVTALFAIVALLQNMMKIISYNATSRAMQNVVTLITIVTVAAALIDFSGIYFYLTLLYCCTAFQLTHMFVAIHNFGRSYIGILFVILVYIGMAVWHVFLS